MGALPGRAVPLGRGDRSPALGNLDDELVRLLKARAAANGRSAEEEHQRILRAALRSKRLADHLRLIPKVGEDADFERIDELPRSIDL